MPFNDRFAYVSASRASHDAQIHTNNEAILAESFSRDVSKTSAFESGRSQSSVANVMFGQNRTSDNTSWLGLALAP